jgi:hypothetical protein
MHIFKALAVSLDLRLFEHLRKGYVQPEHFTNKLHANRVAEVYRKVASQVKGGDAKLAATLWTCLLLSHLLDSLSNI